MPRWYYGWNIIAVAMVFQAVTYGVGLFSFTFFIQPWMDEFGAGRGDILFAVLAATAAIGVLGPFAGRAVDRREIRWIVAAAGAVFATGLLLMSFVTEVWQIIVIYFFFIGGGLVFGGAIAAQTLAAKWFRGRRGFAVGVVTVGTSAGGFLLPPLVTYLIADIGWRDACQVLAALSAVAVIPLTLLFVRNTPEELGIEPDPENEGSAASATRFADMHWTVGAILKDRAFQVTTLAFFTVSVVLPGIQQNLAPLARDFAVEAQMASGLMSIWAGMMVFGKIAFGAASDRIDNRYLFWIEAGLILPCVVLLMDQRSYAELAIICGVLGIANGGTLPLLGSIIANRFGPRYFGQVMGLTMPFLTISSFSYVIAGYLRDATGSYNPAFMAFVAIIVPGIIAMAALPKRES